MKKIFSILIISLLFVSNISAQEAEVKELKQWKFGLHFNTLSAKEKAFNGLSKGVIIHKVFKDQPGETSGMLIGDILTHVGAVEILDQLHCVEVLNNVDTSLGSSTLKIIRNGVKMDVILKFE